jgi:putative tricarboxylic transport membrane protein
MIAGTTLRLGESILGAFVLALGVFIAFETFEMGSTAASAVVGPRLFPFIVAFGLLAVGVALLREAVSGHVAHETGFDLDWRAVLLVSGGLLLQMLLLEYLGWIIASLAMFVLATLAFRERRILISVLIGVVLTLGTLVVFNYGLGLSLPVGTVFEDMLAGSEEEGE